MFFLNLLKRHRSLATVSIILGVASTVCEVMLASLLVPIFQLIKEGAVSFPSFMNGFPFFAQFTQYLSQKPPKDAILTLLIILLVLNILSFLISQASRWVAAVMQENVAQHLSLDLFEKILNLKYNDVVNANPGYYFTFLSQHILVIGSLSGYLVHIIISSILSVTVVYYLLAISWELFLAGGIILVVSSLISRKVHVYSRELGTAFKRKGEKRNGFLHETLEGIKTIKLNSVEPEFRNKYAGILKGFLLTRKKVVFFQDFSSYFIKYLLSVCFLILFIVLIWNARELDISSIEKYVLFFSILSRIIGPLSVINHFRVQLSVNSNMINEYISLDKKLTASSKLFGKVESEDLQSINFENASFTYSNSTSEIFKGLNLKIEKGKKTAIVGSSGSGKSTLIDILLGLHELGNGTIRNGKTQVSEKFFKANASLVSNDSFLFNDSLLFNLTLDRVYSQEAITEALKMAQAERLVSSLEGQLNYVIGPKGTKLSSGERQRILIARALLRNTEIFILDEGTNALDSNTEQSALDKIHERYQERTVISVAHRLNIIKNYDRIIMLSKGEIIGDGTHDSLMKSCNEYNSLYSSFSGST